MENIEKLARQILLSIVSALRPVKKMAPAALPTKLFKRILIVKQHDQLGDLLITTPAIRAVRKKFPNAYIAVVVREYTAPMIWENPYVDDIFMYYDNVRLWNWEFVKSFWKKLRENGGFDCAIMMNSVSRSLTSDLIAVMSKAKYIIGPNHLSLDPGNPEKIYDVVTPRTKKLQLEIDHYLDIVKSFGVQPDGYDYDLRLTEEERSGGEKALYEMGVPLSSTMIGIHFGGLNKEKRLPLEVLAKTIAWIKNEYHCEIILIVGPNEVQLKDQLYPKLEKKSVHVARVLPVRVAAALIQRMQMLLCNDTGTMHIASAMQVPTISFHSISDPEQWKPPQERHIGIRGWDNKITSIKMDLITGAIEAQMQRIGIPKKMV